MCAVIITDRQAARQLELPKSVLMVFTTAHSRYYKLFGFAAKRLYTTQVDIVWLGLKNILIKFLAILGFYKHFPFLKVILSSCTLAVV